MDCNLQCLDDQNCDIPEEIAPCAQQHKQTNPIIISYKDIKSIGTKVGDRIYPQNIKALKAPGMDVFLVIELENKKEDKNELYQ